MKQLAAVALSAAFLAATAVAQTPAVSEAAWLSPEADVVKFLTTAPAECVAAPKDESARRRVNLGRVAFRSPFLLGGQASRGRLSCSACHINGRSNADFYIDGLSSEPGTADVTSSIFSKVREDGALNPLPIPDLVDRGDSLAPAHDLEAFVESAVIDEFQGAAPPPAVIEGLVAYVAALRSSACDSDVVRQSPRRDMHNVTRALDVADDALARGDAAVADFALVAAQAELGRIAERFPAAPESREALASLARHVAGARAIGAAAPKGARVRIAEAQLSALRLSFALNRARSASLYDRRAATAYLANPPPAAD